MARLNLRSADEALAAVKFDRALFETLDATREDASRIGNLRHSAMATAAEVRAAEERLKAKEKARDRANAAAEAVEQEWGQASQRTARGRSRTNRCPSSGCRRTAATNCRSASRARCASTRSTNIRRRSRRPRSMRWRKRLELARRAESKARELRDGARSAAAVAGAAVVAEQQNVMQSGQRYQAAEAELAKACESLATRVGGVIAVDEERYIDEQLRENYQVLSAARQRQEAARIKRAEADEAVRKAEQNTVDLKNAVAAAVNQLAQHDEKIADLTRQIAEIDEVVRKVTQAADPQAERAQLRRRRDDIQKALQERQAAEAAAARELASAIGRLAESGDTCDRASAEAQRARTEARDAAVPAGFGDEAEAAQAEMTSAEEQRISTQIDTHRDEARRVQARIEELTEELKGTEVDAETLAVAETAATQLRAKLGTVERLKAELNTRIEILTKDIERAKELRDELARQRAEHSLYRSLALDLRSDRFQAFLLDESFRELVLHYQFGYGISRNAIALTGRMRPFTSLTTITPVNCGAPIR